MATRVAQHYAQVVGEQQQDGTLHVNRIYADVLISGVTGATVENVDNVMSLTQNVVFGGIAGRSASNTISMTGNAVGVRVFTRSASNTMSLLSLGGRVRSGSLTSNMSMAQLVAHFNLVDDRKPVYNTLSLTQTVTTLSSLEVDQDLGLTQTVGTIFPIKPNVTTVMGLSQFVSTPHREFISDSLSLTHSIRVPLSAQTVAHTLNLVDEVPNGRVDDVITFSHQVTFAFALSVEHTMELVDVLHLQGNWVRDAEHDNFIGHALTWYEDSPCGRKQYTPFQGENTVPNLTVSPPSNVLQDPQGDTGNFSVYQPHLGVPLTKVEMRNPELDNRDRNAYTRINQETRGGKLIVYADPDWPKVRTLAVTIVGLTETKVDELHDFMQDTVGELIGLTDWEGRLWKGFITNPNEAATQDGRDRWTITFEFQGEMLEVEQPGNDDGNGMALNISQSVSAVIV